MRRLVFLLIFVLFFASALYADADVFTSKLKATVLEFILEKNPGLDAKSVQIDFRFGEGTLEYLEQLPDEADFKVVKIYPGFDIRGNVIVPFDVFLADKNLKRIFVRTYTKIFKDIVITRQAIKPGDIIGIESLTLEARELTHMPQTFYSATEEVVGKQARFFIGAGQPVKEYMVRDLPLIQKNDKIDLIYRADDIYIKLEGIALTDGYKGQLIKAKRMDNNLRLEGRVISSIEVEVK